MKYVAKLLGVLVLFLALLPGIELVLPVSEAKCCCADFCKPTLGDDCESENCNPFQVCGSCVITFFEASIAVKPKQLITYNIFSVQQIMQIETFVGDFWQPPRIV
ncbi:MAG: hypothetical protein MH472_12325 [Bacteroidia bacterium]|nr:hypothetical protein [Bacteroidia bacterium]